MNLGQEVVVYTGQGGGECGYPFEIGISYLVYGSRYNGMLSTGTCSQTSPEVRVGGVLKELRALSNGQRPDDLFGSIGVAPKGMGFADLVETSPLSDVLVRVEGSRGVRFSTKTDEHRAYAFAALPPDTNTIEQDLPAGLSVSHMKSDKPITVEVGGNKGNSARCRLDVFAHPDGQISGTVLDADRKGLAGFVTLQPVDAKEAGAAAKRGGLPGFETEGGNFLLPQLPPGRYYLIFYPKIGKNISFRYASYWPKKSSGSEADGIELAFGQHIDHVRFEVLSHTAP